MKSLVLEIKSAVFPREFHLVEQTIRVGDLPPYTGAGLWAFCAHTESGQLQQALFSPTTSGYHLKPESLTRNS